MGNDIQISVKVDNQTGAGLTAVNSSLRTLKTNATAAGQALNTLTGRSTAASQSLRILDSRARSAATSLRGLRAAAGDIRVTASIDNQTSGHITSIKSALRDLKRESPVRLTATFDGDAGQITAAATAMRNMRGDANGAGTALTALGTRAAGAAVALNSVEQQAEDASRALRTLRGRAAAAAAAMGEFRDRVAAVGVALRTFNTRAQTADSRLDGLSGRTRTLRSDSDDLDGSLGRLTTTMGGLRGSMGSLSTSSASGGNSMRGLRAAAIALAPALIPIAAAVVPLAAGVGAAGVAVVAFGLAIGGQVKAMMDAATAEKAYEKAVRDHGRASQQAVKAETEYLRQVQEMPAPTRKAAAALGILKDEYKSWSDGLAGSTMPVATHAFAVFGALLPKLSPLVRGASTELDRLMTVMAGGIQSDGFAKFMDSFSGFAEGALSKATDGLIRFSRVMAGGAGSSQFTEFMAYAKDVGPAVADTLGNLAKAMVHLVASASEMGVSVLGIVNAIAKLVNAVPTSVISTFLQLALAIKAVKLAVAGGAAISVGLAAITTQLTLAGTAAIGGSTAMGSLRLAFMAMSVAARTAIASTGIGLLIVALVQLSSMGKSAPPDIDKMAVSLGRLAKSGKLSGEAARIFGSDFSDLGDSLRTLARPSNLDSVQQFLVSWTGFDSTPVKDAKKAFDGLDKGLSNMVKGGHADLAAAALKRSIEGLKKQGFTADEVTSRLDDYKAALADAAFEQQLAADAQGLFGEQAQAVSSKLDGQKASADGLRGAIQALNDVQRAAGDGMIGFEASIDAAAKAAQENAGSLHMVGGVLDLNGEKARTAATALQDLAAKTDAAAGSARDSGASWETVNGIYERGRSQLIKQADAMGLTGAQARAYADSILKIPNDKTTRLKMQKEDAEAGLNAFNAAVKRTPGSKSVTLRTLSKSAEQILEGFGFKVKRLPNGKVTVTAKTGAALSGIGNVAGALSSLNGRTATVTILTQKTTHISYTGDTGAASTSKAVGKANGGTLDYYADGGTNRGGARRENHVAQIARAGTWRVWGEDETGGESYIPLSPAKRPRSRAIAEETVKRLGGDPDQIQWNAKGGLSQAQKDARKQIGSSFGISHFGGMAGYARDPFQKALGDPADVGSLVTALNSFRGQIKAAFSGKTESSLLKHLDSVGKALIKQEKSLIRVTDQLDKAKTKLSDLKSAASSLASSVKSNILGSANITKGAGGDTQVTTASIMGGLTASRDKSTAFAQALKDLKKKGLSSSLLQQVAEAGIDGGGLETATALLGSSGSEIKSMNALQSQISKAAAAAGKTTADAVFAAQIKAQEKLVKSLTTQQDKLEKSMAKLANSMEKLVQKALSGKASGGIIGAASGGARGGMTWVGEQGPEIVRLPYGSSVKPAGQSRRMYAPGGGGGGDQVVLDVTLVLDGKVLARQMVDPMRDQVLRIGGGSVQKAYGRG